jgi:hypothetical protein
VPAALEQAGEIKVLHKLPMDLQGNGFTEMQRHMKMGDLLAQSTDQVRKSG